MTKLRLFLNCSLWNMLVAAVVFLPAFLLAQHIELFVVGALTGKSLLAIFFEAIFMFIILVVPILIASMLFSIAAFVIPRRCVRHCYRLKAVLLSILFVLLFVACLIVNNVSISVYFVGYWPATALATICYGFFAIISRGREDSGESRPRRFST